MMSASRWGWVGSAGILIVFAVAFLSTRSAELADATRDGPATMADNRALWMVFIFLGLWAVARFVNLPPVPMLAVAVVAALAFGGLGPDVRGDNVDGDPFTDRIDDAEDIVDGWLDKADL